MHLVIGTIALSHPVTSSPTGPEVGASSLYPSKITVDSYIHWFDTYRHTPRIHTYLLRDECLHSMDDEPHHRWRKVKIDGLYHPTDVHGWFVQWANHGEHH